MPASRSVIAKLLEHPVTNNDLPARRGRRKRTWVDSGIEAATEARADVSLLVNDIPSPKRFKHSLALLDGPLGSSYGLRATAGVQSHRLYVQGTICGITPVHASPVVHTHWTWACVP